MSLQIIYSKDYNRHQTENSMNTGEKKAASMLQTLMCVLNVMWMNIDFNESAYMHKARHMHAYRIKAKIVKYCKLSFND